jgi:2,3-bisphosphoglycerate-independent phosphoglycerate mutase
MEVLPTGTTMEEEFQTLKQNYADYDFFFLHIKPADNAGEDGNFDRRVEIFEQFDRNLPELIKLNPDVIVVAGDHSTPAMLRGHSWHPVPVLLYSKWCRPDRVTEFSESACASGALGRFPATQVMPLAMANALKLTKFGA